MTEDVLKQKLARPDRLSDYASDAALRYMAGCELPYATELNRIADAVIGGAGYLNDPARLLASLNALAPADRAALERIFAQTAILQIEAQLPQDAVQELGDALNFHWPKACGFDSLQAAREELGDEVTDTIQAFVLRKSDAFWKRDALASQIDKSVLSEKDMRIIAEFGAGSYMHELAGQISGFVEDELLRASLLAGDLKLPPGAVARIEIGINRTRHRSRPDWPPVSLTEWLT